MVIWQIKEIMHNLSIHFHKKNTLATKIVLCELFILFIILYYLKIIANS